MIQFVDALANQFVIVARDGFPQGGDAGFDFSAFFRGQGSGLRIGQRFCRCRQDRFGFRARLDDLALGEILLRVLDGLLEHTFDFGIVDAVAGLDFDGMLVAGAKVFRAYLQDAVSVDQEFYLDAWKAGGRGRNSQSEASERAAVLSQLAFPLQNVDVNAGLIVDTGGVKLLCARGDRGVARNNFCDGSAVSLDAERKRRDVEQQHGFDALVQNAGLRGRAERHDFVRIQFDVRLAAEKFLYGATDQRRARGAADENDFVHVGGVEARVGKSLLDRAHGAVNHGANKGVESASGKLVNEDFAVWHWETKRGG